MSFAENLVYLRQHYGVTQEGLAEQLGVSRQTVSKWEAGTNYPEMDKLLTLCDLFHVSMDDLMRGAVSIAREGDTERYDRHMNRYDAVSYTHLRPAPSKTRSRRSAGTTPHSRRT